MYPRGRRTLEAALVLLALMLSALALVPSGALATSNQVVGLVYFGDCRTSTQNGYVQGARVTLNDANGVQSPSVITTGGDGSFTFTPPTGSYWINITRSGYYPNQTAVFPFDGSSTRREDICVVAQPTANAAVTFNVQNTALTPISGATVSILNVTEGYLPVTSGVTNTTGLVSLALWGTSGSPGGFQIRTSASGYKTDVTYVNITGTTAVQIRLSGGSRIVGHALGSSGQFLSAGLVAWLYNPSLPTSSPYRLVPAIVNISQYDFHVPTGTTYQLIVDANGYTAASRTVTAGTTPNPLDLTLSLSPQELYKTTVAFGAKDWNNFTVSRTVTLNADSSIPFLVPTNIRNLRYQIDATFGNGDGILSASEATAFSTWLQSKGPFYLTTDTFLLVNGKSFNATTANAPSVANLLGTGPVWINSTDTYRLRGGVSWIAYGASTYYVNTTLVPDQSAPAYQNFTYTVQLPDGYEMLSDTVFGSVTVSNYTHVNLDPAVQSSSTVPQVKMIVVPAKGGIAKAKVVDPVGKFFVTNSTYQGYKAYVANNTTLTFSAGDSFNPPSDDATRANFTWRFQANTSCGASCKGYGIQSKFKYTTPGEYVVNLTMVGSGGNVSYRNITLWVDGSIPVPSFRTNLTGSASAVGQTLRVNQGGAVRFDGGLSTDLAYTGKSDPLPNGGYLWDFDGNHITDATGRVVNWTFTTAGQFTVNLTLTDAVGWKAGNVSMTVIVNDTEAPRPSFVVLDPSSEYAVVPYTNLFEGHTYVFNASKTTDNHDSASALNYTWSIPGPLIGVQGTNTTFYGSNITFGWTEFNTSYAVKLKVRDTGYPNGKSNNKTLTQNLTVQVCSGCRPDLKFDAGTLKIDNTNPEEGQTITVTVNVTNKVRLGPASHVTATVSEINSNGQVLASSDQPQWLDASGNPLSNRTIATGATVTLRFTLTVVGQGNMTIKVNVKDSQEPYTWVTAENAISMTVLVRQAAWVNYAIIGSVLGVFVVVVGAMYYRRKVRSGDWEPRFRRAKKEKGGEGEEKRSRKEKEVKEEKKRL